MTEPYDSKDIRGGLTAEEWREIVTLDYILIWRYTDDYDIDLRRYKELAKKRWGSD
jgi:hypothetical protein